MNFEKGKIYHVYNRSFEKTIVFRTADNYKLFIKKLDTLTEMCEILAFCIMPNHFHLMIYIPENTKGVDLITTELKNSMQLLSRKIGTILSSYTQALNKSLNRKGSLFQPKTKCKELSEKDYPFTCFHYIHQNPIRAKLVAKMEDWEFSSFNEYYNDQKGIYNKQRAYEVLAVSNSPSIFHHQSYQVINYTL